MFVWTLLGVALAVLVLLTILSVKAERAKYVEERSKTRASVTTPSAARP